MNLKVRKLSPDARLPSYGTPEAAGLDLFHLDRSTLVIAPGMTVKLGTGLAMQIPQGFAGVVRPRSSAFKRGLIVQGLIDSDYRGEVFVVVTNASYREQEIEPGSSIAQLVVLPYPTMTVVEVEELLPSLRGNKGFGSTGNT